MPAEDISAGEPTYRLDCSAESGTMIISFAVFPRAGKSSAFDFVRATGPLAVKKAYLRDPHMMWYQKGTPGIGETVDDVLKFLRGVLEKEKPQRLVTIGNSGGGFAALLFGVLLGADEIHAFNPVTRLLTSRDTTAPEQLDLLLHRQDPSRLKLDLAPVLRESLQPQTKIFVHYSRGDRHDVYHAHHVAEFSAVRLIGYPLVSHHLARYYTIKNRLTPLLQAAADGDEREIGRITTSVARRMVLWYPLAYVGWFFSRVWSRLHRYAGSAVVMLLGMGSVRFSR